MRLRSPTASSPQRSRIASRTPLSSARSVCTNSSLDAVAAPRRANAASASLLPAAMPPVIATATGRRTLLVVGVVFLVRARLGLVGGFDRVGFFVGLRREAGGLDCLGLDCLGLGLHGAHCCSLVGEHVL